MWNLNYIIYFSFFLSHISLPCLRTQLCSSLLILFPKNDKGNSENRHVGTKEEAENTDVLVFLQTCNKQRKIHLREGTTAGNPVL